MKGIPFILLLFIVGMGFAQPGDDRYMPSDEFIAVQGEDGLWGFQNAKGDWIQDPVYKHAHFRRNSGIWVISEHGKTGFATRDGHIIRPEFSGYQIMPKEDFCETTHAVVKRGNNWGIIGLDFDNAGKWLIRPWYGPGIVFHGGYVLAQQDNDQLTDDWGIADEKGTVMLPFEHSREALGFVSPFGQCGDTRSRDYSLLIQKDRKYAWASMEGELYSDFEYEQVWHKRGSQAIAKKGLNQVGIIDTTGKVLVPFVYEMIWYSPPNETPPHFAFGILNGKKFYFDQQGNILRSKPLTKKEQNQWDLLNPGLRN